MECCIYLYKSSREWMDSLSQWINIYKSSREWMDSLSQWINIYKSSREYIDLYKSSREWNVVYIYISLLVNGWILCLNG